MKTLFAIFITLILMSCTHTPDYQTGQDCWRAGIVEQGNTGRMSPTPIMDISVIPLKLEALYAACDIPPPPPISWSNRGDKVIEACYQPRDDKIYILNTSQYSYILIHERCHALLGREHNSCYGKGYAQWGDNIADACEWDDN